MADRRWKMADARSQSGTGGIVWAAAVWHIVRVRVRAAAGLWLAAAAGAWAGGKAPEDYVMEVTLTRDVTLPVVVLDRQAGTVTLRAGKTLEVVDVTADQVLVEAMGATSPLPRDVTDIAKRIEDADTSGLTRRDLRDALKHRFVLVGMTPAQVLRAAGPPLRQAKDAAAMYWWYPLYGDVPKSTRMTVSRGTPETEPCFIPGGYVIVQDPRFAPHSGHRPRGGTAFIVRQPPTFFPGFVGESIQINQETVEKGIIGERLLVFEAGRLVRLDESGLPP